MKRAILSLCILVLFTETFGQNVWKATASPAYWNDPANWSLGVPGVNDAVVFDNTSNVNCELDVSPTIGSITINGYTGTIDIHGRNWTISSTSNVTNTFATGAIANLSTAALITVTATASASAQTIFSGTIFRTGVNLTVNSGSIYLNGSTFNGTSTFTKYSTGSNTSKGGNTFNGPTTIALANYVGLEMILTSQNADVFNGSVNFTNGASTGRIYLAYAASCTFNGNVVVGSAGLDNDLDGIFFGNKMGYGGNSTLAAGRTLSVTAPYNGALWIENFTQSGNDPISLTISASFAHLYISSSTFNGNFSCDARRLDLYTSTFKGATNKFVMRATSSGATSTTNSCSFGTAGITGTTTFERTSSAASTFQVGSGGSFGDNYYNNVIFRYSGGGTNCRLAAAVSGPSNFYGDITWDNNSTGAMAFGTGTVRFSGSADQSVNQTAGSATFSSVVMDKTGTGKVTLNTPLIVNGAAQFIKGVIYSSATNYAQINSVSGTPNNTSYVDGPVQKVGTTAFTFPTGNNDMYGPIQITAPSSSSTFAARFFRSSAKAMDPDLGTGLAAVSDCEYWTLDRTVGTGNVDVSLSWGAPSSSTCLVSNKSELRVAQYDGSQWTDKGNNSTFATGGNTSGSIRSATGTVTSFAFNQFALASSTLNNPLPIELISFDGEVHDDGVKLTWETATEMNNDHYEIERSGPELKFVSIGSVQSLPHFNTTQHYEYIDRHPLAGKNYYRLKQVDLDGTARFFKVVPVVVDGTELRVYPNPALSGTKVFLNQKASFSVVSGLGEIMMRLEQANEFESSELMPGIYTLIFDDGGSIRLVVR